MKWTAITKVELQKDIEFNINKMDNEEFELWSKIRIEPKKWEENEMGREGDGFYAVAIIEDYVLWYNDIEDGYNLTKFITYGKIPRYQVNQYELREMMTRILIKGASNA